jgi:SAM-dependent methyltransferase
VIVYREHTGEALARYMAEAGENETPPHIVALLGKYAVAAIDALGPTAAAPTFLDVGCRFGAMEPCLDGLAVYEGIDINPAAVARGLELGRTVGATPRRAVYDIVFCRQTIQFSADLAVLMAWLSSLVAPGGILFLAQSIPYDLADERHANALDSADDLRPLMRELVVEHVAALEEISTAETVVVARRRA